uniref:ATP synthase F0 subunit 8 n=1 Tax=Margattea limbata TaxID=3037043 RepID=UPI00279EE9A5|nr:ATP synthase F0 subunit 8 [Margattea limbata]WGO57759.1 ATP synthase F0 subunit 8 [Margattea limbata]
MPQMMPMNWLFQFTFFLLIFMIFVQLNYFHPVPAPLSTILLAKSKVNSSSWKW